MLDTAGTAPRITATDYDYRFPDHWLVHERQAGTLFERLHAYYVGRVIELLQQNKCQTVLEVGCGDGWNCGQMVKEGLDVVGIDWSEGGIQHAQMLVPGGRFFKADVRDADFLWRFTERFDGVALIEVLEHIPPEDCVAALRNIIQPLKRGGIFVLTTPSENTPNTNPQHYQHFTERKLRSVVAEAGDLEILSLEGYGDARAERSHYALARWVDNRYYRVKPALRALEARYHSRTNLWDTPFDRCHGFIMVMRRL